jgi:hypothetical protein
MDRLKRLFVGGSLGNEQLTAVVAALLLLLLAIEGATLLNVSSLLALKAASTAWRFMRYYGRGDEYVRRGPPHIVLRALVAPVLVLSTLVVFGTGVALLVRDQTHGTIVGLHKASFLVWVGAFGLHVLWHAPRMLSVLRDRIPGTPLRATVVAASIVAGGVLATATLPQADHLQDRASSHIGFDER